MDIDYICEFVTLAETCNYMEAADQLFISQSALSRHIKALEENLGIQLFDRTTRKVSLSPLGRVFLPYAKQIVSIRSEYQAKISNALHTEHGNIRIGTIPSVAQYGITDMIARFHEANPSYSVDIMEADSTELVKMLRSGQCNLAFLREDEQTDSEFNTIHYTSDSLSAFMRHDHPFASRKYIRIEQLQNQPLMLISRESMMYNLCVKACQKAGFTPNVVFTGRRAANMLELVRKGMGIALLTERPIQHLLTDDLAVVDIEPRIITNINLAYPKDRPLSFGARWFVDRLNTRE